MIPCHTTAQTTDAPTNAPASKDDFFQNKPENTICCSKERNDAFAKGAMSQYQL